MPTSQRPSPLRRWGLTLFALWALTAANGFAVNSFLFNCWRDFQALAPDLAKLQSGEKVRFGKTEFYHFGADPVAHLALIERQRLTFSPPLEVAGAKYRFSEFFEIGEGRIATLCLIETAEGKTYL